MLLPLLKYIPLAVLFGLFLYMGVVSMKGQPVLRAAQPVGHRPGALPVVALRAARPQASDAPVHRDPTRSAWSGSGIVKTSTWGILFPLFIALLVPIRFLLGKFFDPQYLAALDAEETPEEEEETWL